MLRFDALALIFQFHKGAIRTAASCLLQYRHKHFNSIKVRLELRAAGLNPYLAMQFQFHKGAIRTKSVISLLNGIMKFQFHKGAIRTESG